MIGIDSHELNRGGVNEWHESSNCQQEAPGRFSNDSALHKSLPSRQRILVSTSIFIRLRRQKGSAAGGSVVPVVDTTPVVGDISTRPRPRPNGPMEAITRFPALLFHPSGRDQRVRKRHRRMPLGGATVCF